MPAKSKAQQALFGMALAVRRGDLERSKVNKEVLDIVDSNMTNKQIEDFASTSHKGLKDHVKESLMKGQEVLVVIKPGFLDHTQDIIKMFESDHFVLLDTKLKKLTLEEAQELYLPHKDQPFYEDLCTYMSSESSLALLFASDLIEVFDRVKELKEQAREMYGESEMKNAVHGSDSKENVEREKKIYFE